MACILEFKSDFIELLECSLVALLQFWCHAIRVKAGANFAMERFGDGMTLMRANVREVCLQRANQALQVRNTGVARLQLSLERGYCFRFGLFTLRLQFADLFLQPFDL